jgi:hypothetical protein
MAYRTPRWDKTDGARVRVGFVLYKVALFSYRSHSASASYTFIYQRCHVIISVIGIKLLSITNNILMASAETEACEVLLPQCETLYNTSLCLCLRKGKQDYYSRNGHGYLKLGLTVLLQQSV